MNPNYVRDLWGTIDVLLVGMLVMAVVTARAYDRGDGVRPEAA